MTISPELQKQIEQEAEHYANVQHSEKGKHVHHHNSLRWDDSKDDWEAGATEYATKLHQVEKERDELKRQNDKLKEQATGWRPLLEEILKEDRVFGTISTTIIEKITTFLYGE